MTYAFVTSAEYAPKLTVMIASLRAHHPEARIVVMSCEPPTNPQPNLPADVEVLPLELVIPNWDVVQHHVSHISGVARVFLVQHLLHRGDEKVLYLDSDMFVYDRLDGISNLLDEHQMVITPHILTPYPEDGKTPNMENIVRAGNYNSAFIAVSNTPQVRAFVNWWGEMCQEKASVDYSKAHYSEQNWLRFAGDFVDNIFILRHGGYNLAHWNFAERGLKRLNNGRWGVSDGNLFLGHFSSICADTRMVSTNQNRQTAPSGSPMYELITEYKAHFPNKSWPAWNGGHLV